MYIKKYIFYIDLNMMKLFKEKEIRKMLLLDILIINVV